MIRNSNQILRRIRKTKWFTANNGEKGRTKAKYYVIVRFVNKELLGTLVFIIFQNKVNYDVKYILENRS